MDEATWVIFLKNNDRISSGRSVKHSTQKNSPTIYEMLASTQASSTTISNLNDAVKSTYIDTTNIEFWAGVITVSRALKESRTFAHGLPIVETANIEKMSIADGGTDKFGDDISDTAIIRIENIDVDGCSFAYTTNGSDINPITPAQNGPILCPLFVTKQSYLMIANSAGSTKTPSIAYSYVSL
jgi:hypothetical protein